MIFLLSINSKKQIVRATALWLFSFLSISCQLYTWAAVSVFLKNWNFSLESECYCEAIYVSSWEQGHSDTNVHWQVMQHNSLNNVSNETCTHIPTRTEAHTMQLTLTSSLFFLCPPLPSSLTHTHTHLSLNVTDFPCINWKLSPCNCVILHLNVHVCMHASQYDKTVSVCVCKCAGSKSYSSGMCSH